MKVNCANCGESVERFPNQVKKNKNCFCDQSCAAAYNNKKYPKRERKKYLNAECINCGKPFSKNTYRVARKYCPTECQRIYIHKKYIKRWLAGKESGNCGGKKSLVYISSHVREWLIETRGNKCEKCGWCKTHPLSGTIPVQVNHIDGNAYNTIPENLELICPNCHSLTPTYGGYNRGNGRRSRTET